MTTNTLQEMKENMKRFRNFMDKIDSHKFKMSLDNEFEADENRDIDEIKDIKRLKDLLSKPILV